MEFRGVTVNVGVFPVATFSWGAVTGTTAGQTLTVQFTGTVLSAQLELEDGRILTMAVGAGELTVALPLDTPDALATITATLPDASTRILTVALHSLVIAPGPSVGIDLRPRAPVRALRSRTRIRLTSSSRVRAVSRSPSQLRLSSSTRVQGAQRSASVLHLTPTRPRSRSLKVAQTRLALRAGAPSVAHRDGPELELLLLDAF
jgi:hypothetical protein